MLDTDAIADLAPYLPREVVLRYLCRFDEIPGQTDARFVVDRDDVLCGMLPIKRHLVSDASIEKIVALSVSMTVNRSIRGNASTQTMARVARRLALEQINRDNLRYLFYKELAVAYYSGLIWAVVVRALVALGTTISSCAWCSARR